MAADAEAETPLLQEMSGLVDGWRDGPELPQRAIIGECCPVGSIAISEPEVGFVDGGQYYPYADSPTVFRLSI